MTKKLMFVMALTMAGLSVSACYGDHHPRSGGRSGDYSHGGDDHGRDHH
jgi:hypothetical protein